MYFILTKRVLKKNTGATEKFAPRSNNYEQWTVSGPFTKRSLAERTASAALGTHTCLSAQVFTIEEMEKIADQRGFQPYNGPQDEIRKILGYFKKEETHV